jgi:6-phosphofructokinase
VEAASGFRGLGIVKLMGRNSGFIAMQASMSSGVVDVCLIPEVRGRGRKQGTWRTCNGERRADGRGGHMVSAAQIRLAV